MKIDRVSLTPRIASVLFMTVGGLMLWQILAAPEGRRLQEGDPGPWLLPGIMAIALIVLGAVECLRHALSAPKACTAEKTISIAENDDHDAAVGQLAPPLVWVRFALMMVTLVYVAAFERLGFSLTTVPFLTATIFLLSDRTPRAAVTATLMAVIATFLIGFILGVVVRVPLPGMIFF